MYFPLLMYVPIQASENFQCFLFMKQFFNPNLIQTKYRPTRAWVRFAGRIHVTVFEKFLLTHSSSSYYLRFMTHALVFLINKKATQPKFCRQNRKQILSNLKSTCAVNSRVFPSTFYDSSNFLLTPSCLSVSHFHVYISFVSF